MQDDFGRPLTRERNASALRSVRAGKINVALSEAKGANPSIVVSWKFTPTVLPSTGNQMVNSTTPVAGGNGLPLDIFVTASNDPTVIMGEYAKITGSLSTANRHKNRYDSSGVDRTQPRSSTEECCDPSTICGAGPLRLQSCEGFVSHK